MKRALTKRRKLLVAARFVDLSRILSKSVVFSSVARQGEADH
ncbi:hypothetical protein [Acidiphilium sp. 20-67-58]|nr:hypothetical protein [Acidiphilium sp. 20-67-58]